MPNGTEAWIQIWTQKIMHSIVSHLRTLALGMILTAGSSLAAQAEGLMPDRVYVPLKSFHVGVDASDHDQDKWNEFNPGLIGSWENRGLGLTYNFGAFVNSHSDLSTHISVSKVFDITTDLSIAGFAAFADYHEHSDGFDYRIGDFIFIPGVQANYKNFFVQAFPLPTDDGYGAVLAAGLTFRLHDR